MASEIFVGGTYRFEAIIFENESDTDPMNISGATVTVRWHRRNANGVYETLEFDATVVDGPNGLARYDNLAADIDLPGEWQESWLVELEALSLPTQPESFTVRRVW